MVAPLRICLLTGEYPPDEGGVADYTRCLAEALAARGAQVDVVTNRAAVKALDAPQDGSTGLPLDDPIAALAGSVDASTTEPTPGPRPGPGLGPGSGSGSDRAPRSRVTVHRVLPPWRFATLGAMQRLVGRLRPDVVHLQYQTAAFDMHPAANLMPWWLGLRTPVATAITYHDLRVPYLFPKAGRLRNVVTRLPARTADLAIVTNADDWRSLETWGQARNLALVPIGSNVSDTPPPGFERGRWRRAAGIPDEASLLAYFGFLNASKGGRTLLEAVQALRSRGRDVRLVMIGGRVGASDPTNAGYLADFEADAAARGLEGALQWTGHVPAPEVSAWLHAADALVLPYADGASFRRGSLLAALAHGRPTVTTHAPGGPPTQVAGGAGLPPLEDGRSARLAPPDDGPALAAAVASVLDDPALAERLAEGARAVADGFGWEAIAARHAALYAEVLGRAEAAHPRTGVRVGARGPDGRKGPHDA